LELNHWQKSGCSINEKQKYSRLYSTGLFKRDGTIRIPNSKPKPNEFGKIVGNFTIKKPNAIELK